MSALRRLPQQREICLPPPVMVESVSICALYSILLSPLTSQAALFIDPKATCVYLVYHYTLTSSRHMLSGTLKSVFRVLGLLLFPCQLLITLELLVQASPNLGFKSAGWYEWLSSPRVLTTGGDARCSDPAKNIPHYPNETLAWAAPSLAHHRPPHKASAVLHWGQRHCGCVHLA